MTYFFLLFTSLPTFPSTSSLPFPSYLFWLNIQTAKEHQENKLTYTYVQLDLC